MPTRVTSWTRGLVTWLGVDVALLEDPITSRAAFLLDVASVDGDRLAHGALARGGAVGKVGRWCCAAQSANGAARRATLYSYPSAGVARALRSKGFRLEDRHAHTLDTTTVYFILMISIA